MVRIDLSKTIEATPKRVLDALTQHAKLDRFFNAKFRIIKPENEGEPSGGKGTIRQVNMGRHTFLEEILYADEAHIAYRILGKGPVTEHRGDIRLAANGESGSALSYRIQCKGPKLVPDFIVKFILEKDIKRALDKLARHFHER